MAARRRSYDALIAGIGHNRLLGHRHHDHGANWIALEMPWQDRLAEHPETGGFARGPMATLLDNAAGSALWVRRGGFLPQVTIELRIDHIRPSRRAQAVIARCECHAVRGDITYVRGVLHEAGADDPVCVVAGTFMLLVEAGR